MPGRVRSWTAPVPAAAAQPSEDTQPSEASAPRAAREPWRPAVFFGAGAAAGLIPGVAPLLELGASAESAQWGVIVAARYLPYGKVTEDEGRGVTTWALGGLAGGVFKPLEWLRLSAAVAVHRLEGEGFGIAQPTTDTAWSVTPQIEAAFSPFRTDSVRLEVGVQGFVAVVRPRFEIGGVGEVYRAPLFGGAALARVAWLP